MTKESFSTDRLPLYNECAEVIARLTDIIPRVLAERTQASGRPSAVQQGAIMSGRLPLYNDCAEETRRLLARIDECLQEDSSRDA